MENQNESTSVRVLCRKLVIIKEGLQWLIGSPFLPQFTIVSTFKCIHSLSSNPLSPDFSKESDDMRTLVPKGFEVIGALIVGRSSNSEQIASETIEVSKKLRKFLYDDNDGGDLENRGLIGAAVEESNGDVRFFLSRSGNLDRIECVGSVVYEDQPEKYIWERGCLLRCELPIKLPLYYPANSPKGNIRAPTRALM
ncbi:unnamed protein product [Ilex paraguariensis]|uniref:Ufm1-specific protease n=1 Tax=Ilex paraguariensis TaxID=185542 RepID=A0ABC8SMZ2_9AQUA